VGDQFERSLPIMKTVLVVLGVSVAVLVAVVFASNIWIELTRAKRRRRRIEQANENAAIQVKANCFKEVSRRFSSPIRRRLVPAVEIPREAISWRANRGMVLCGGAMAR
jgi:hypothetical protein